MKVIVCILGVFVCLLGMTQASPANAPGIQFLKYTNDMELEELQKQIIAQYETLGGSSQFHEIQQASFVDPAKLKISVSRR